MNRFVFSLTFALCCLLLVGCSAFWGGGIIAPSPNDDHDAPPIVTDPTEPPTSSDPTPPPKFDLTEPPAPEDPVEPPPSDTDPQPNPPPNQQDPPDNTAGLSAHEMLLLQLVNEARSAAHVPPLTARSDITDLARLKAKDMVDLGYFSHDSPTYGSPREMLKAAGIDYRFMGENIAKAGSVQQAFDALMHSEGHRKNILSAGYTHIGLGVIEYGNPRTLRKTVMVVQLFLTPRTRD